MPCRNDIRQKPASYRYNPYEVAFCGVDEPLRTAVMAGVMARGFRDCSVGHVIEREDASVDRGESGVNLIVSEGRYGLLYPSNQGGLLRPMPLIDCDVVFVESAELPAMPKVIVVGDGEVAAADNVLAYVGTPESCPILPSSATYFTTADLDGLTRCIFDALLRRVQEMPIYGLVLAGGHSTRMNADKSRIDYHGQPHAHYTADLLSRVCDDVFYSVRPDQVDDPFFPADKVVPDAFLGYGQMGAILTAIKYAPQAAWLVAACDMPFVDEFLVQDLVARRNPFKIATAYRNADEGFPEPLFTIYEPKAAHRMFAYFAAGYHCPRKVLINSDICLSDLPDAQGLMNANYPEERESASAAIQEREQGTTR